MTLYSKRRQAAQLRAALLPCRQRCRWRHVWLALILYAAAGGLLLGFTYHVLPLNLQPFNARSRVIEAADGSLLAYTPTVEGRLRFLSEPSRVDPLLVKLLLLAEDERFYAHPGVDVWAIGRAIWSNLRAGQRISGASTLDMQCIRLLDRRARTYKNKIIEALLALKLRHTLGAAGVLRLYLSLAPMGSRLEGVRAGSLAWFGREPQTLTPAQAALLTVLPRAPELLRPDRHLKRAHYYVAQLLKQAQQAGLLSPAAAKAALHETLPTVMRPIAQPGFYLKARLPSVPQEYRSSIDPQLQAKLLTQAARFNRSARSADEDLAIVVIDDVTHQVVGYLGGRDMTLNEVDLASAVRSPGSALKPFAYAMAIEARKLHPLSLISDDRAGFNTYQPRNFDGSFSGFISAKEALLRSLNVPAVKILQAVGPDTFFTRLNQGKARVHLPEGAAATLPLILGGCGISLFDLSALYSMLNTQGLLFEPSLSATATSQDSIRLLSASAAAQVWAMLQDSPPPAGFIFDLGRFAYKTGTSHNYADALAIGSCRRYTVGIWIGRRSGQSNYPVNGRSHAAPLLFALLQDLADKAPLPGNAPLTTTLVQKLRPSPPPPFLQFFDHKDKARFRAASLGSPVASELQFIFPQSGMQLLALPNQAICVEASGGTPPYLLYVNDKLSDNLSFTPAAVPGFYRLTLLDQKGTTVTVDVKLINELTE